MGAKVCSTAEDVRGGWSTCEPVRDSSAISHSSLSLRKPSLVLSTKICDAPCPLQAYVRATIDQLRDGVPWHHRSSVASAAQSVSVSRTSRDETCTSAVWGCALVPNAVLPRTCWQEWTTPVPSSTCCEGDEPGHITYFRDQTAHMVALL